MNGKLNRTNGTYSVTIEVVGDVCEVSVAGNVPNEIRKRKEELNHSRLPPAWIMNQLFK